MTRRHFLSSTGLGVAGLLGSTGLLPDFAQAAAGSRKPPNIVLIMADDMGFSDIGCYGSEISTPNLDSLAAKGVRFTQFYSYARCCPTRASLLTGLHPHQAGVGHMVGDYKVPGYRGFLNDRCVTLAEVLREAGYHTLMSGKWHVGEQRPHWPVDRGFERYFGLISGASNYFRLETGRTFARDDQPYTPDSSGFYITDAFGEAACQYVQEYAAKENPFFLYLAFTSPHWPLHAWPEDIARYRGKYLCGWDELRERRYRRQIEMGLVDAKWPLTPRDEQAPPWAEVADKEERDLRMAIYAAQIDRMDYNIGRVMAQVRSAGVEEDTLVMFLADNGGCAERIERGEKGAVTGTADSYVSYGLPWANASNTPFRLYKHWVHEGGISSPFIAYWPSVIRNHGGILRNQFGHLVDVMATCVDVSGAEYPTTYKGKPIQPMEGRSLTHLLRGQQRERPLHDVMCWEHEGNKAVRKGRWKLVSRYPARWELYDMAEDRTEMRDLADRCPEKVREMVGDYEDWARRCKVIPWQDLKRS
ncbi:MAG: arylsulfatase [Armatimonadia bacterium]